MSYKYKLITERDYNPNVTARMPIALFNEDIQAVVRKHTNLNFLNFTYMNPDITFENGHRIIFYIPTRFTTVTDLLITYL